MKAIIVEDILENRTAIKRIVASGSHTIDIVFEATTIKEAQAAIQTHQPDLVFLDVELPDGTSFELLQKLKTIPFKIIFITAYQDFSIKAFKYGAIDYILKPIDKTELLEAIDRAFELIDKDSMNLKLQVLINNFSNNNKTAQKIVLKTVDSIFAVNVNDVIRCEASGGYTFFYLNDGRKVLVSKTMKEYDELLTEQGFYRVHHAHLINMSYFDRFMKADGGKVFMKDASEVPVSSRKYMDFVKFIENIH